MQTIVIVAAVFCVISCAVSAAAFLNAAKCVSKVKAAEETLDEMRCRFAALATSFAEFKASQLNRDALAGILQETEQKMRQEMEDVADDLRERTGGTDYFANIMNYDAGKAMKAAREKARGA